MENLRLLIDDIYYYVREDKENHDQLIKIVTDIISKLNEHDITYSTNKLLLCKDIIIQGNVMLLKRLLLSIEDIIEV